MKKISIIIYISGYMLIGLGIGYLTKIKHLNKT